MTRFILLLLVLSATVADGQCLWQSDDVRSTGGGWYNNAATVRQLRMVEATDAQLAKLLLEQLPAMHQYALKHCDYEYHWYGFRFGERAYGLRIMGRGSVKLTFSDPLHKLPPVTVLDVGIIIPRTPEFRVFVDTAGKLSTPGLEQVVCPYPGRPGATVKCLIRIPKEVSRALTLTTVEPLAWEPMTKGE